VELGQIDAAVAQLNEVIKAKEIQKDKRAVAIELHSKIPR